MIAIDNKLVSDELVEEQFVCDLIKCKGGCCVDGDAGAPLDESEKEKIEEDEKILELQIILNKYVKAKIAKGKGYETISEEVYRSVDLIERDVKRLYKLGYKIKMK